MNRSAVFLDKDGTLLRNVPYNVNPDDMQLMPGAIEFLHAAQNAGYRLFVISNQPGIARGYFPESAMRLVWNHLGQILQQHAIALDGFYYCPHAPPDPAQKCSSSCLCRKPAPGLLLRAAKEHGIDLKDSWMVGDILDDIEAGRSAGCRTILVNVGNETEWKWSVERTPTALVRNLRAAARLIEVSLAGAQR